MSTHFVCCRVRRDRQYSGVNTKIRVDGQKLQTETYVFKLSKLVTLLRLFLVATESYEGFFKTTKTTFTKLYEFYSFLSSVSNTTPAIDSPEISKNVFKPDTFPHPRFFSLETIH